MYLMRVPLLEAGNGTGRDGVGWDVDNDKHAVVYLLVLDLSPGPGPGISLFLSFHFLGHADRQAGRKASRREVFTWGWVSCKYLPR